MRRKLLSALLLVAAAAFIGCGAELPEASADPIVEATFSYPNTHPITAITDDDSLIEQQSDLEQLINKYRFGLGLDALVIDSGAGSLALAQAVHMTEHAYFGHQNPEGDKPEQRADLAGINFKSIGENLAAGQLTAQTVLEDWLKSPLHRENLESPKFTHMGVGYFKGNWVLSLLAR